MGDLLTWLGLALLAFELAGGKAGAILAGALTLRVMAFVVLSPIAGAIADQVDRKHLMITPHLARMGSVCLLPFVTQTWQIYALVLSLNVFYAFFGRSRLKRIKTSPKQTLEQSEDPLDKPI